MSEEPATKDSAKREKEQYRIAERERWQALASDWHARADQDNQLRYDWRKRWQLSLSVGNGAGLFGLAGLAANSQSILPPVAIVIGMWVFFIGVVFSGVIPLFRSLFFTYRGKWADVVAQELAEGGGSVPIYVSNPHEPEDSGTYRREYWKTHKRSEKAILLCEFGSVIGFFLGVFSPIVGATYTMLIK